MAATAAGSAARLRVLLGADGSWQGLNLVHSPGTHAAQALATCPNTGSAETDMPVLMWTGQLTILQYHCFSSDHFLLALPGEPYARVKDTPR